MLSRLAWTALTRHRARTVLAIAGVAVSAAMLLDMVMLSSGLRASFRTLLLSRGFQLRIAPKGTLPFDTDALIPAASGVVRVLAAMPGVDATSPVLGGQLHVEAHGRAANAIALGGDARVQGDYEIVSGRPPAAANEAVANEDLLNALGARIGDTISAAAGYDPELRSEVGRRTLTIVGAAHFLYLSAGGKAIALPLGTLQAMQGARSADRVSLFLVRAHQGVNADSLQHRIAQALPSVTVVSTDAAMRQVDERLSYFRQLAVILGAVSLAVGFLLVATLVTVSVNERLGEIVVLRAIGMARWRVVSQILMEGTAIMVVGTLAGLGLGLVTGRYLNTILAAFPGLPAAIDFFLFEPHYAWYAMGMLAAAGVLAGIYPAWRGASRPIAVTLREEAVG